jgi:tetratricopeptide (TPR) repeat protein
MSKKDKGRSAAASGGKRLFAAPPTVSLCMIVKNEEAWLAECLESVKDVVDEMVIVDTGSTDRTVDIARGYGARIYHLPWRHDFAAARNESLRHARSDWILILDADERLDAVNRERLRAIVRSKYDGVFVRIDSPVQSLQSGLVDVSVFTRLFRNRPGVRFEGIIHEQILPSIQRTGGRVADSDLTIFHAGYAKDAEAMRQKHLRNLTLLEKQVAGQPDFALGVFHLGEAYQLCERYEDARAAYRRALDLGGLTPDLRAQVHQNLAYIFLQQDRYADALEASRQALALQPDLVLPRVLIAQALTREQRHEEAIPVLQDAIRLAAAPASEGRSMLIRKIDPYFLHIFLGQTCERCGQRGEAREAYLQAHACRPQAVEALLALGKGDLESGQWPEACRWFGEALGQVSGDADRLAQVVFKGLDDHLPPAWLEDLLNAMTGEEAPGAPDPVLTLGTRLAAALNAPSRCHLAGGLALRLERHALAERLFMTLADHPDATPSDVLQAGQALRSANRTDGAVALMAHAVRLRFPEHVQLHFLLGALLVNGGRYDDARSHLETVCRLSPATPEAQYALGVIYLKRGNLRAARHHVTQALASHPDAKMQTTLNLITRLIDQEGKEVHAEGSGSAAEVFSSG